MASIARTPHEIEVRRVKCRARMAAAVGDVVECVMISEAGFFPIENPNFGVSDVQFNENP